MEEQTIGEFKAAGGVLQRRGVGFAAALALHALVAMALINALSFRLVEPKDEADELQIVTLVSQPPPPPSEMDVLGAVDSIVALPRFRPRVPQSAPGREQKRYGDPALAIWKYLCNRDGSLSEATQRDCPTFSLGEVDMGLRDPLNRNGDVGALYGADTATMSHQEIGRKKGWFKPKAGWTGDGARSKKADIDLPGHDPFDFLPKERSQIWGGKP